MTQTAQTYDHPFHLVHETPAGRRVAYPQPGHRSHRNFVTVSEIWQAVTDEGIRRPATLRDGYIVTDQVAVTLVRSWMERGTLGPWRRREDEPVPTGTRLVWKTAPDEPTADVVAILEDRDDEADMTEASLWHAVYERERAMDAPAFEEWDVSATGSYPGDVDPAPNRTWTPEDTSVVAVYGPRAAHLQRGYLTGFRAAVVARIEEVAAEMGLPGFKVYNHSAPKVSVFYDVHWDKAVQRPKIKGVDRGRGPFRTTKAMTQHVELVVPDRFTAATKQEALDGWADAVERWVAKFIPLDGLVEGCSACKGRGFFPKT